MALWELGTAGIREEQDGERLHLIAGFEAAFDPSAFAAHDAHWEQEDNTDWVAATQDAWPAREIGDLILLAPVWNTEATPDGRIRVTHNPGLASGTGEHPCTQLALESLEKQVTPGCVFIDVGTGSGILAVSALHLGARTAIAVDTHFASLLTATENFSLNRLEPTLVNGSADCLAGEIAGIVAANISGTVLLSMADDLLGLLARDGVLVLTGFPESELSTIVQAFGNGEITALNEWRCLTLRCP